MHIERTGSQDERGEDPVAAAAAHWLARRDRGLTAAESEDLRGWLSADPRHEEELARLEASWHDFDLAKADPELVAMASELDRATVPRMRRSRLMPGSWTGALTMAAAAVVLFAGLAWWQRGRTDERTRNAAASTYQVIESAARRIVLDDGSVAEVRDDSVVRAEYTTTERHVVLVRGEAHFTVTTDATRPFVVSAGGAAVRAVGTAFNVRFDAGSVEVLVTEGTVQVADSRTTVSETSPPSPMVVAGQRAVIARDVVGGASAPVAVSLAAPAEVEQALAWQSTRLVFERTSLEDAVAAFNRHSSASEGVRLVIGDPALRARRMGGTFRASNVGGFVRLLEQTEEIRAERRGDQIVLLPVR